MGDLIQKLMEDMIPELEDLQAKKIFSPSEIKAIVKKRTDFEYRIKAKIPQLPDFLRYIQYEVNLDRLRIKRKEKLPPMQPAASDVSANRRISFIFDRALRKFGDNVGLWEQYIEFCRRSGSSRALSKIFPRALQLHPLCASLWIQHAKWEFDDNQNAHGARSLIQRALRVNPDTAELWVYFFKMEIQYIAKLRERKRVLGLLQLKPDQEEQEGDVLKLVTEGEEEEEKDLIDDKDNAFFAGALPLAIYKNAIKVPSLKDNFNFRLQIIDCIPRHSHSAPVTKAERAYRDMCDDLAPLATQLWDSVFAEFQHLEECWQAKAQRALTATTTTATETKTETTSTESTETTTTTTVAKTGGGGEQIKSAIAVFEEAVAKLSTSKMWGLYGQFLAELLSASQDSSTSRRLCEMLQKICQRARDAKTMSEELFFLWASSLLKANQLQQAITVLDSATAAFPQSLSLWQLLLHIESQKLAFSSSTPAITTAAISSSSSSNKPASRGKRKQQPQEDEDDDQDAKKAEEEGQGTPLGQELWERAKKASSEPILLSTLELLLGVQATRARAGFVAGERMFREVIDQFSSSHLKCRYVDWSVQAALATAENAQQATNDIHQAVDWVLHFPGPSLALYTACLEAQQRCPLHSKQRYKTLLESSVEAFPSEAGLWLRCLQVESGPGKEAVYWRAMKTLPQQQHDLLSAEYTRLQG